MKKIVYILICIIAVGMIYGCRDNKGNKEFEENKNEKVEVGDWVTFGKYEQDDNTDNGKEDIEWRILEIRDGKALVISKKGLEYLPYNNEQENVTWDECTLRHWLNNQFIKDAFSTEEMNLIQSVEVDTEENPEYKNEIGKSTVDKIFILSVAEVDKYFKSDTDRETKATSYADMQSHGLGRSWWLRNAGLRQEDAAMVDSVGDIDVSGIFVSYENCLVRPAMWIELSEITVLKATDDISYAGEYKVGDYIECGLYEQDNNLDNGKEMIKWRIIHIEGEKALVVSEYVLDWKIYIDDAEGVSWEKSNIREWLNGEFIENSFNENEVELILNQEIPDEQNPYIAYDAAKSTQDKLFLLSMNEVNKYFSNDEDRKCFATEYAIAHGASTYGGNCVWWLRTRGNFQSKVVQVYDDGDVYWLGDESVGFSSGVRPAMWIDLAESKVGLKRDEEMEKPSEDIGGKEEVIDMRERDIGETITLGKYEQDNCVSNGKENIEWIILDKRANEVLLISKYVIDCVPYNVEFEYTTWATSSIRQWLNFEFVNTAFNNNEKAMIATTNVSASGNPNYESNPGYLCQDKVFLLGVEEMNQYFRTDVERQCDGTEYIQKNYNSYNKEYKFNYWLRTIGSTQNHAVRVNKEGDFDWCRGVSVAYDTIGVRPVMWINLNT